MIGSRYEETRIDLGFKIRNNLIENKKKIDEGLCYLCKGEIKTGYLLECTEKIRGNESVSKFPVHKECYISLRNPDLRVIK